MSYLFEKPSGSNPTSPGRLPSSFAGRSKNGTARLISMVKRDFVTGALRDEIRAPLKEEARTAGAKPETKANIARKR